MFPFSCFFISGQHYYLLRVSKDIFIEIGDIENVVWFFNSFYNNLIFTFKVTIVEYMSLFLVPQKVVLNAK